MKEAPAPTAPPVPEELQLRATSGAAAVEQPGPYIAVQVGLVVAAGLLLLAAFPPVGWWWSAAPGVAALLAGLRGTGLRRSWALAALAHLVLFLPLLEWVRFLGVGPWVALSVLQAAVAGLLGPLVVLVDRTARGWGLRAAGLVGAVVLIEAVRARVPFNGLTWGRLGFGQSEGPLLPLAAAGGAPLVGAAVALVAMCLLALLTAARRRRGVLVPFAVLTTTFAVAAAVPTPVDGPGVQVATVQGNVPRSGLSAFAEDLVVLDNHLRETERLAAEVRAGSRPRPDLVIWPENASDQDPRTEPQSRARVDRAVEVLGQPLLLGAVLRDGATGISNGIVVYGEQGVQGEPYRKKHLVPFGEYLPLRGLVERVYPAAGSLLPRDFSPGNRVGRLDLNGVPLAVGTCFEVAFDDLPREAVRAGGELLVLPSNNASYGRSAQSAQQLAMARLRAVEHGRSTVVSTTSGISALVRPDGEVVARSGLFVPAVLQAELPRRTALTLATRFGLQSEAALALLVLLPFAAPLVRVRPTRLAAQSSS